MESHLHDDGICPFEPDADALIPYRGFAPASMETVSWEVPRAVWSPERIIAGSVLVMAFAAVTGLAAAADGIRGFRRRRTLCLLRRADLSS